MATEAGQKKGLIACMLDVLAGKADVSQLAPMVEATHQELEISRVGFEETVSSLEPSVVDKVQQIIDLTREVIAGYGRALDVIDEYLRSQDRNVLVQGAEQVNRSIFQINRGFQTFRDAVLVAQGPSEIPNYNLLLQSIAQWRAGTSPLDKLRVVIERERIIAKRALLQLVKEADIPEVAELKRVFQNHLDTATRLGMAARDKNNEAIDLEAEKILQTFQSISPARAAAETAVRSQGPSPSGLVNLIVNTGQRLIKGQTQWAELAAQLDALRQTIRSADSQFQVVSQAAVEVGKLQEAIELGRKAFATYNEAFGLCDQFFEQKDAAFLERALQLFVEASKTQNEAEQKVLDFREGESKSSCIKCGHQNPSDRARCEQCGTALPLSQSGMGGSLINTSDAPDSATQDVPIISDTFRRVYEAVNGITDGTMTMEKFTETIQWFEELVRTNLASASPPRAPKDATPEVEEAIEKGKEQFEQFKKDMDEAIAEFKAFIEDGNQSHLLTAVQVCNKGANELVRMDRTLSAAGSGAPAGVSGSGEIVG